MSRVVIKSIEDEYQRYRFLAEKALAQVPDQNLNLPGLGGGTSLVTLIKHLSGNFKSRWSDFLTTDGEKEWRDRDQEFVEENLSRIELLKLWNDGWAVLEQSISELNDGHLEQKVRIRNVELSVIEALHRSLAHASYHIGQMIYLARCVKESEWESLTIPLGGSKVYNLNPDKEKK
jgi:hypothetical protein